MKEKIHPKYYETVVTCGCGNTFKTRSTREELKVLHEVLVRRLLHVDSQPFKLAVYDGVSALLPQRFFRQSLDLQAGLAPLGVVEVVGDDFVGGFTHHRGDGGGGHILGLVGLG